jgi:hypothetical protein
MRSSRSNNVGRVSPVEFRKLCSLLETIFAQTVSCEVYELFKERCFGCKLNRFSQSIGSPKRRVECTNNASKCQFALSSPHSFVICRAPQALN